MSIPFFRMISDMGGKTLLINAKRLDRKRSASSESFIQWEELNERSKEWEPTHRLLVVLD